MDLFALEGFCAAIPSGPRTFMLSSAEPGLRSSAQRLKRRCSSA